MLVDIRYAILLLPVLLSPLIVLGGGRRVALAQVLELSSAPMGIQSRLERPEAAALLSLRSLLGIRSRYWPRKAEPCSIWTGVSCTFDGLHVSSLNLTTLRRTVKGSMTPAFALDPLQNLSKLISFSSSGFALPGHIPDWFGSLPALQHLDLSSSSISGSIPSSLGNLVDITFFDVSHNNLSGSIPPELGNLVKLEILSMGGNGFEGLIPPDLGSLSALRSLDLRFNALSGPIPTSFGQLKSLVSLALSGNSINGSIPIELSNCLSLENLLLDRNDLMGRLPVSLGISLGNLSILSLYSNNLTGNINTTGFKQAQQILVSNNSFYGTLQFMDLNMSFIKALDISSNFFEGSLPNSFISTATTLDNNCFTNAVNQRTLDECEEFYSEMGLIYQGAVGALSSTTNSKSGRIKIHLIPILAGVFGGLGFILLIILFISLLKRQRKTRKDQGEVFPKGVSPHFPGNNMSVNLLCLGESFTYAQLVQATRGFDASNFMKSGHSGDFYQGMLDGGVLIAVKRIDIAKVKREGYLGELDVFSKASHTRLVTLLGYCFEREDEKFLVYKFMPARDLGFALHKKFMRGISEDTLPSLDWITRLKIAIGAAEGLTYLHHECTPPLVHRDIQASSILLDEKFEVRLGSLSDACIAMGESHLGVFSRILRRSQALEHGEAGNASPTCAHDVYCFGKVLLELVSGKLGLSGSKDPSTSDAWIEWSLNLINLEDKDSINKILDPSLLVDEDLLEEVWAMSIVAKSCLNPKPSKRPLMRYVLKALENPLKVVREEQLQKSMVKLILNGGGSQGSVGGHGEVSLRRPGSSEIFPEPDDHAIPTMIEIIPTHLPPHISNKEDTG